jgi:hypothetical protein
MIHRVLAIMAAAHPADSTMPTAVSRIQRIGVRAMRRFYGACEGVPAAIAGPSVSSRIPNARVKAG